MLFSLSSTTLHYLQLPLILLLWSLQVQAVKFHDGVANSSTDKIIIVGSITLEGNKITQKSIIYRELLFNSGDTLTANTWEEILSQSRQNLLNTSLFNFVEVKTVADDSEIPLVDVSLHFVERWYIWPVPVLELADRNFNEWWETRDFSRLNYGFYLNHNNFRGRKEQIRALFLAGHRQAFSLSYLKPNLNNAQTIGLGFNVTLSRKHELPFATHKDQLVYFYNPYDYSFQGFTANILFYYRPQIHESHSFWIQYSGYRFNDTIYKLNPRFFINDNTSPRFLSLIYEFRSDRRNLKYYPTSGYYYDLVLLKHGLGIFQKSDLSVFNLSTIIKKYFTLKPRWYLLAGASAKFSFASRQAFFMSNSLGYLYDFVRGYEYYVINGRHVGLIKTNLKYQLLPNTIINLPFIKTEKFSKLHLSLYVGVHSDIGYVYEPESHKNSSNRFPNRLLWGNGIGFDVVTYYDRVMRMEYSINHLGEHGFFLHFLAPI